jgi:hypothetical protein
MIFTEITTRPQTKKFNKTIILVGGVSYKGKTTLCSKLMNEDTGYISLEKLFKNDILGIPEIKEYNDKFGENATALESLVKKNKDKYFQVLISEIDKINKSIILIDGTITTSPFFLSLLKEKGRYNIWSMKKIKSIN